MKKNNDLKNLTKIENGVFNMKQTQCCQNGKHCQLPAVQLSSTKTCLFLVFPGINSQLASLSSQSYCLYIPGRIQCTFPLLPYFSIILYIITVSDTLFQLHNRRENQSEKRMENCAGIRAFSLVLISPFRLIPNHNVELIAH